MSDQPGLLRRIDASGVPLLLARLILGALFIIMGWNKAVQPGEFLKLTRTYQMIPDSMPELLNLTAITLPWLEIFCGVLLIAGIALRGTALLLIGMLVFFTGAVIARAIGIYNAQDIAFCAIKFDCGCGSGEQYICHKVPENLGLLALSFVVLLSRSRRFALWPRLIPSQRIPWSMQGY